MFISVKEAAELTGKSATTIYRLCNKRKSTQFVIKEDNKFLIDKEFLLATYPDEQPEITHNVSGPSLEKFAENKDDNGTNVNSSSNEEPVIVLEESSAVKNEFSSLNNNPGEVVEKGSTLEFDTEKTKSFYQNFESWEVLIGISVSLLIITLLIVLLSLGS